MFYLRNKLLCFTYEISIAEVLFKQDMCVINDPLGQINSSASSDHYSRLNFARFWKVETDARKDGRTDNTCENSDH